MNKNSSCRYLIAITRKIKYSHRDKENFIKKKYYTRTTLLEISKDPSKLKMS